MLAPDAVRTFNRAATTRGLPTVTGGGHPTCGGVTRVEIAPTPGGTSASATPRSSTNAQRVLVPPELAGCSADQISIETAQSGLDLGVLKDLSEKKIILGVIDLSNPDVESAELVVDRVRRALPNTSPDWIIIATDCGMKYLPRASAEGKMRAVAAAASILAGRALASAGRRSLVSQGHAVLIHRSPGRPTSCVLLSTATVRLRAWSSFEKGSSMHRTATRTLLATAAMVAAGGTALASGVGTAASAHGPAADTTTPINHVVVIFQENVSFDHYFGTYPNAANTGGQSFTAKPGTPTVNGLTGTLLTANPNGVNPRRYSPTAIGDVLTCDQDHNYSDEQKAFDNGAMDKFPQTVGQGAGNSPTGTPCVAGDVMNYYDGNTTTALWNYAQHYSMSDISYGTTFGPSSPGAVNLVSGDTGAVDMAHTANNPSMASAASPKADLTADAQGGYSLTSDAQPYWDDCSTRDAVAMSGQNIGRAQR
jgi:hypothetical protein